MATGHNTTLRRAGSADADAIRHLVRAAYAKWVPVIGREPRPMVADYRQAADQHDIDMLFVDDVLVGLIETVQHPDHLWVENIAVSPDQQGKGWGRQLLAFADHKAMKSGCGEIRLLTNEAFATNIALYQRWGYGIDRKEPFHPGGTTVYMSKRLGNTAPAG